MTDYRSLSHTKWTCQYHVVFIPKYRKKVIYGELRRDLGEVLRRLAQQRESEVEGFLSRIGATWAGLMAYKPRIVSDLRGRRAPSVSGEELQAPGRSGHTSQLNRDGAASSKGAAQSARGSAPAWNVGESRGRVRWLSRFVAM